MHPFCEAPPVAFDKGSQSLALLCLQDDNRKLKEQLGNHVAQAAAGVTVEKGRRLTKGELRHAEKLALRAR